LPKEPILVLKHVWQALETELPTEPLLAPVFVLAAFRRKPDGTAKPAGAKAWAAEKMAPADDQSRRFRAQAQHCFGALTFFCPVLF